MVPVSKSSSTGGVNPSQLVGHKRKRDSGETHDDDEDEDEDEEVPVVDPVLYMCAHMTKFHHQLWYNAHTHVYFFGCDRDHD